MRTISTSELEKKIGAARVELAEMESLLSLLRKYGSNEAPSKNGNPRPASSKKASRRSSRATPPPNSNGLKAAILALNLNAPVTVDDVVAELKKRGLDYDRRQVRDSIHVLVKKSKGFRRVKQGKGGEQSLYERVVEELAGKVSGR